MRAKYRGKPQGRPVATNHCKFLSSHSRVSDGCRDRALDGGRQESSRYGHRDATMILLGYRHGLRASELCDFEWSQIELATGRLHVRRGSLGLVLAAIALGGSPGLAQNVEQEKLVFEHVMPNIEGKSMVAVVVTYPPAGKSPAHHHARSAFIYAHVLSGAIRSQVGDEPAKVYQV
jgi:hypothetical protein